MRQQLGEDGRHQVDWWGPIFTHGPLETPGIGSILSRIWVLCMIIGIVKRRISPTVSVPDYPQVKVLLPSPPPDRRPPCARAEGFSLPLLCWWGGDGHDHGHGHQLPGGHWAQLWGRGDGVGLCSGCVSVGTSWRGSAGHPLAQFLAFSFCSWSSSWRNETQSLKLSHAYLRLGCSLIRRDQRKAKGFFCVFKGISHVSLWYNSYPRAKRCTLLFDGKKLLWNLVFSLITATSDSRGLNILQESSVHMGFPITSWSPDNEMQNVGEDWKASKLLFTSSFRLWCWSKLVAEHGCHRRWPGISQTCRSVGHLSVRQGPARH